MRVGTERGRASSQSDNPTNLAEIVGEDETGVLHEGGNVGGLATRSGSHVEDTLVGLRGEGHNGQERRCRLDHVLTRKVLRCERLGQG